MLFVYSISDNNVSFDFDISHMHKACVGLQYRTVFKGSWACHDLIMVEKNVFVNASVFWWVKSKASFLKGEELSSFSFFYHSKAVRAEAEYFWTNDSFCKLKFQNKCFNYYRWTRSSPPTSPPSWLFMLPSIAEWFPSYQLCTIKSLLCCSPKHW